MYDLLNDRRVLSFAVAWTRGKQSTSARRTIALPSTCGQKIASGTWTHFANVDQHLLSLLKGLSSATAPSAATHPSRVVRVALREGLDQRFRLGDILDAGVGLVK